MRRWRRPRISVRMPMWWTSAADTVNCCRQFSRAMQICMEPCSIARRGSHPQRRDRTRRGCAPRNSERRNHPRPRTLRRLSRAFRGQIDSRGRTRRRDGFRIASERDIHPRSFHMAHRRHHARPRSGRACARRARQDAFLERRRTGATTGVWPTHWCDGMERRRTSMIGSEHNCCTPRRCERWK